MFLTQLAPEHRIAGVCAETIPILPRPPCSLGRPCGSCVVCGRCLSSTRRISRWSGREIARSAVSLVRSAQPERDNESYFFARAAGVHRFIRRYHDIIHVLKSFTHDLTSTGQRRDGVFSSF
ncbi:hypothetical protein EVAR_92967_1 [Eumeta japonica]|uniref:Uncharacterized protein n=1 Tax=Eumeta variegata TaxID=151549 RepID=A0A4C1TBH5_EUMVA|nr:hypothetical protein EVAR_92967_1 [Eumeta japonica]